MRKLISILPSVLGAAFLVTLMAAGAALAQDVVYVESPTSWTSIVIAVAVAALPILGSILIPIIRTHYGEKNAKLAEDVINALQTRLQGAVGRASGLAINSLGTRVLTEVIQPSDPAVKAGIDYLRETMGDTLKELKLDTTKGERILGKMIVAQIGEKTASALAGAVAPPADGARRQTGR